MPQLNNQISRRENERRGKEKGWSCLLVPSSTYQLGSQDSNNYYQIIYSYEQFSPTYKIDDIGAFIQDSENRYMKRTGKHQYNEKYLRNQKNVIANFLSFVHGIDAQKYLKSKHI